MQSVTEIQVPHLLLCRSTDQRTVQQFAKEEDDPFTGADLLPVLQIQGLFNSSQEFPQRFKSDIVFECPCAALHLLFSHEPHSRFATAPSALYAQGHGNLHPRYEVNCPALVVFAQFIRHLILQSYPL